MSILCDVHIRRLLPTLLPNEADRNEAHINPASIDICVGRSIVREGQSGPERLSSTSYFDLFPGEFALIATLERIAIPNGYAADLRLKSSIARQGFNHSLAFWVDPGWDGILTMEVQNCLRFTPLRLNVGQRFAQLVIHELSGQALKPYSGKYNNATYAEGTKP